MPLEFRVTARGSRHSVVRLPPIPQPDPLLVERLRRPRPRARAQAPTLVDVAPLRLRHVLAVGGIGLAVALFVPRALAYVRLHEAASSFANYALCMVGPTGPSTLVDRPQEFQRLVRRRLVAAPADSRPFEACAPLLDGFGEDAKRGLHAARAADFREYAPSASGSGGRALADLDITSQSLWRLARVSWPFGPASPISLVQPSRTARAAAHPVSLPSPASGRGLPDMDVAHGTVRRTSDGYVLVAGREANQVAFVSRDGGISWAPLDRAAPLARASLGHCSTGEAPASFQLASDGDQLRIESWQTGELQTSFPLAPSDARRVSLSCDARSALALIVGDADALPRLQSCPHAARCRELALPPDIVRLAGPESVISVARVRGVSVVAIAAGGVVRVVSSRDDGETWTPPVVAYDREEHAREGEAGGGGRPPRVPSRLLALEDRVLLYAGADLASSAYPALASDDFGASWRGFGGGS
jgi:hypothetical protein